MEKTKHHKEREIIIMSTVDDEITDFAYDSHRLNVAFSRAINQLNIVTDGNEPKSNSNIGDLIGYIKYNNYEIIDSKVYSNFDYLYKYYEKEREEYLKKVKKSQNLIVRI